MYHTRSILWTYYVGSVIYCSILFLEINKETKPEAPKPENKEPIKLPDNLTDKCLGFINDLKQVCNPHDWLTRFFCLQRAGPMAPVIKLLWLWEPLALLSLKFGHYPVTSCHWCRKRKNFNTVVRWPVTILKELVIPDNSSINYTPSPWYLVLIFCSACVS